jgi:C-terminal processing protease CtpA/Prc
VTLRSEDGAGFGFELDSDSRGGLVVASVADGGPASASGAIRSGIESSIEGYQNAQPMAL